MPTFLVKMEFDIPVKNHNPLSWSDLFFLFPPGEGGSTVYAAGNSKEGEI